MTTFGFVSLATAIVMLGAHSGIIDYFLIGVRDLRYVGFGVADAIICLYLLLGRRLNYAAVVGSLAWMAYSWVFIAKLGVLYFVIPPKQLLTIDLSIPFNVLLLILYLPPVIFAILSARAAIALYGTRLNITVISMIHSDVIVHVMLDLIDLMQAAQSVLQKQDRGSREFAVMIIVGLALFMHSYSFSSSTPVGPKDSHIADRSDIFLTRKHAALIGMFFVDVPLLTVRIIDLVSVWNSRPQINPLLWKNILFVPLQAHRLNQCRLAEKLPSGRRNEADEVLDLLAYTSPQSEQKPPHFPMDAAKQQERDRAHGDVHYIRRRLASAASLTGPGTTTNQTNAPMSKFIRRSVSYADCVGTKQHLKSKFQEEGVTALGSIGLTPTRRIDPLIGQFRAEGSPEYSVHDDDQQLQLDDDEKEVQTIFDELRDLRQLPARGFNCLRILVKIWQCARVGTTHQLSDLLDARFVISYWRQLRFLIPLITHLAARIIMVGYGSQFTRESPLHITRIHGFNSLPRDFIASTAVSIAGAVVIFCCFLTTAPFFDVLFVSVFWGVRCLSYYFAFAVLRDTLPFGATPWGISAHLRWVIPLTVFGIFPAINIILGISIAQSAILGRQMIYVYAPPTNYEVEDAIVAEGSTTEQRVVRSDEVASVSTSVTILYAGGWHKITPMAFHELIIGPDTVKSVRLLDHLLFVTWNSTVISGFVRVIILLLFWDWPYVIIFGTHFLFGVVYCVGSQAIRILALRRYEVHQLFEEIIKSGMRGRKDETTGRRNLDPRAALFSKDTSSGFYTSPGHIWPPLL